MARISIAARTVLLAFLPFSAMAQAAGGTPTTDTPGPQPVATPRPPFSMVDGNFLTQSAADTQTELARAALAQNQGGAGVRDFATTLTKDRTQLAQQLQIIARQEGVQMPAATSQPPAPGLAQSNGEQFDRAFLALEARSLDRDIEMARQEADTSANPALRDYAKNSLPLLQAERNRLGQLHPGR